MIALDEDALICDLAETYHIYDMYSLPCEYVAILACGLRNDSRIKMKALGLATDVKTLLLAHIADNTAINYWLKTEDGQKGRNRPDSLVRILSDKDKTEKVNGYETSADFEAEWRRINGC